MNENETILTSSDDYFVFLKTFTTIGLRGNWIRGKMVLYDRNMEHIMDTNSILSVTGTLTGRVFGQYLFVVGADKRTPLKRGVERSHIKTVDSFIKVFDLKSGQMLSTTHARVFERRFIEIFHYQGTVWFLRANGELCYISLDRIGKDVMNPLIGMTYRHYAFGCDVADVVCAGNKIFVRKDVQSTSTRCAIFNCHTKEFRHLTIDFEYNGGAGMRDLMLLYSYRKGRVTEIDSHHRTVAGSFKMNGILDLMFVGDYVVILCENTLGIYFRNGKMIREIAKNKETIVLLANRCIQIDNCFFRLDSVKTRWLYGISSTRGDISFKFC